MEILKTFYKQITDVFTNGVFGMSLFDLGIIILAVIFALLIRGIFAKVLVNKVRKIVKKPLIQSTINFLTH